MSITVYTLPQCVQCDMTKKTLDSLDVEYVTVDLSQDKEAASKVLDMGYKQAPVVITDTAHWSGFRLEKLKALKSIGH